MFLLSKLVGRLA